MKIQALVKTLGVLVLFISGLAFGQTQVPNTFQAGQPARAADVNANFTAVEVSVDDNAADVAANAVDIATNSDGVAANAASIGNIATLKWLSNSQPVGSAMSKSEMVTFTDYYLTFDVNNGRVEKNGDLVDLVFIAPDCAGQAYVGISYTIPEQGAVFRSPNDSDPTRLYYYPLGSSMIENVVYASRLHSNGCTNEAPTSSSFVEVFANDPAVTGVSAEFFDTPMTIRHR